MCITVTIKYKCILMLKHALFINIMLHFSCLLDCIMMAISPFNISPFNIQVQLKIYENKYEG